MSKIEYKINPPIGRPNHTHSIVKIIIVTRTIVRLELMNMRTKFYSMYDTRYI